MDALVQGIRNLTADAFFALPLLIIGFSFFFGLLTSNIGLLFLFIGHLIVAPALSFLSNEPGPIWFEGDKFSITKALKWLFSIGLFFGIHGSSLSSLVQNNRGYLLYLLALIPAIGQFVKRDPDVSVFWFANIIGWFFPSEAPKNLDACSINIPSPQPSEKGYSPSNWLVHITFFFGFILTNAIAIFNEPVPAMNNPTEERQKLLDSRVRNRKTISAFIIAVSLVAFITLLVFRYGQTPCESSFLSTLIPLTLVGLTGASWFTMVYTNCGVRPADVLGMVQGMISPDLADNPVVCVGSK